jgi:MoaA/NifB/PqqE/SkfB family radical SAM enzyme
MNIDNIKKIELEITSNCNAACPGCARTQNLDSLVVEDFSINDLKRIFPDQRHINNKQFKFCGVLGDPIINEDCLEMIKYLVAHGGYCQLSTNGSLRNRAWWQELGQLSKDTGLVDVNFCVDGHKETNHIYRVNTSFDIIARNMEAYAYGGEGRQLATWIYIVFDHNEHELETAKEHAVRLGFKFATRTGMRNSMHDWVAKIRKKTNGVLVKETAVITTTGSKEHSKKALVKDLDAFINTYKPKMMTGPVTIIDKKTEILNTMQCKLIHEGEIFIASNQSMWPCCFLWDSAFMNKEKILDKLADYGNEWNSLKVHSIEEILAHPWFDSILAMSWEPGHSKHLTRCIRTCAYNKAYQNEITHQ